MVESNKFFKTKVDFAAPIKMLHRTGMGQNLSEDTSERIDYHQNDHQYSPEQHQPAPPVLQGVNGEEFEQYPLSHPANLQPIYRDLSQKIYNQKAAIK